MQSHQILATMRKSQLIFLSVLTIAILLCYRQYLLYSTKEKNTSYNFGKFRVFQHAIVTIHAILIWIERKRGQQIQTLHRILTRGQRQRCPSFQ